MILVTGGTGLVGSELLRQLVQHEGSKKIIAIKRTSSSLKLVQDIPAKRIEWVNCDIQDVQGLYDVLQGVEQVYHSAAMVSIQKSEAALMHQINVEGTSNLVNMCLQQGVKKMVHVSSIAALGRSPKQLQLSENSKWVESKFNTAYAVSKYQSENEVWRAAAEGLNMVIVNPSLIMGVGHWGTGSARLFQQVYKGLKFYPPGGTGTIDVIDLCTIMRLLMHSNISKERFIVSAYNKSYQEILQTIADYLRKPAPNIKATPFLSAIAWRAAAMVSKFTGKKPFITQESLKMSRYMFQYNNSKIVDALDYTFIPWATTMQRIAKQYLAEHAH